jgi:hypothetical protein
MRGKGEYRSDTGRVYSGGVLEQAECQPEDRMRTRTAAVAVVVLLAWLGVGVPAAQAQGNCSLQTFAGTYASFDRGSSVTIDLSSQGVLVPAPGAPTSPLAWLALGIVPFVNIAVVTYTPDGIGDGYFWMFSGPVRATLDPIPVHITVTELNENCTGKFQYTLANGATIVERFVVFDEGRQYRSLPQSGGIPTLAWIGTGRRISNGSAPIDFCGPQTAHGSYVMTCENIMRTGPFPTKAVSDTFIMRIDVSQTGEYTGLLYEKYGATSVDARPVSGTVTVNPDCSQAGTLYVEGTAGWVEMRGVFLDRGKELWAMGIKNPAKADDAQNIQYSFCQAVRIGE